jgi:glutaredoxin 3
VTVHYVDVKKDPEGMKEMLRHSKGSRRVPVIVEQGVVTVGYGGGG